MTKSEMQQKRPCTQLGKQSSAQCVDKPQQQGGYQATPQQKPNHAPNRMVDDCSDLAEGGCCQNTCCGCVRLPNAVWVVAGFDFFAAILLIGAVIVFNYRMNTPDLETYRMKAPDWYLFDHFLHQWASLAFVNGIIYVVTAVVTLIAVICASKSLGGHFALVSAVLHGLLIPLTAGGALWVIIDTLNWHGETISMEVALVTQCIWFALTIHFMLIMIGFRRHVKVCCHDKLDAGPMQCV